VCRWNRSGPRSRCITGSSRQRTGAGSRRRCRHCWPNIPTNSKSRPGRWFYELQPNIDWNKGRAVLYLIDVLGLDSDGVVLLYLGDDITDEDAFRALRGRGIGIFVGRPDDPEVMDRPTAAEFVLASVDEVQQFLITLAR